MDNDVGQHEQVSSCESSDVVDTHSLAQSCRSFLSLTPLSTPVLQDFCKTIKRMEKH